MQVYTSDGSVNQQHNCSSGVQNWQSRHCGITLLCSAGVMAAIYYRKRSDEPQVTVWMTYSECVNLPQQCLPNNASSTLLNSCTASTMAAMLGRQKACAQALHHFQVRRSVVTTSSTQMLKSDNLRKQHCCHEHNPTRATPFTSTSHETINPTAIRPMPTCPRWQWRLRWR